MAGILDLDRDSFFGAMDELGIVGEQRDDLVRQYREKSSPLSLLMQVGETEPGMVRSDIMPFVRPEGMSLWDAWKSGDAEFAVPGFLTGAVSGSARAFDAPGAAGLGLIPEQDMAGEALGVAGAAQLGGGAVTRPMGSLGMGGRVASSAAEPRNAAEQMARGILDMRAAGRAGEVTDEMMAQADPQYMFANTPLPMDEASRMARARKAGFDVNDEMYRGDATRSAFQTGQGQRDQIGVTMSSRPDVAASYIPSRGEGGIYPLFSRGNNDAVIGAEGRNWNVIDRDAMVDFQGDISTLRDYVPDSAFEKYDVLAGTDFLSTNDLSRLFQGYGADRVRFNDLVDRGSSARYYGPESSMPSDVAMVANPANVRSRFARFDPEFNHLSNLSAANVDPLVGLLGVLAAEEQRRQRNSQ